MKKFNVLCIKYLGSKCGYLFRKLGYAKRLSKIDNLPESNYYERNSFFDADLALHKQYLKSSGWLESKSRNQSCRNGIPVPWITYPSFEVLDSMSLKELTTVEFGAGASTHYFAARSHKVISYEFDTEYL